MQTPQDSESLRLWLEDLPEKQRLAKLRKLNLLQREELQYHWKLWARADQLPPGEPWRTWVVMAGRGFGKTRAGAEWVRDVAETTPDARFALVAASLGEARAVMVEGDSGLLSISPPDRGPLYEPSLRRLSWPSGAQATLYSAGEPEALRGPQHSHASRTGAEGSLRQRSPCPCRCPAALCHRRHSRNTADRPAGWPGLAGWRSGERGLGGTKRQACLPAGRKLAVYRPARRDVAA